MSTHPIPTLKPKARSRAVPPPLQAGDRLSRAEFHRRYLAHPEIKKAELIEGVVYMPSPIRFDQHSFPHAKVMAWLGAYWSATTPETNIADNATLFLDRATEVQPDALLCLRPEYGGRVRITEDDYLTGSPELIIEIAASSAAYDLHDKKRIYARNGVREYLVVQVYEQRMSWFIWNKATKKYDSLAADEHGIFRSHVFPGLWLDPNAFWEEDRTQLIATLQQGLYSSEYKAFRTRLAKIPTTEAE
jgi:Uma2 family endonuclease